MALTSEQYKYLLVRRMQRHVATSSESDRCYYLTFMGKLLDDSVTVTEASYNEFNALLEQEMAFCAENGYYLAENIPNSDIDEGVLLLQRPMESIGIQMEHVYADSAHTFTFTKPNGEVMTLKFNLNSGTIYIFPGGRMEYGYARYAAPYYRIPETDVPGLNEINTRQYAAGMYWEYDSATATMTISGSGSYKFAATEEEQVGSGVYATLVLGPGISEIGRRVCKKTMTDVVLLRPADAEMSISTAFNGTGTGLWGQTVALTVYTDCAAAIETLTGEILSRSITVKSLSEWEG